MVNRPKAIGTAAETAVTRFLRSAGWPAAERRALTGALDQGDITGIPGICVEVKGGKAARTASDGQIAAWLAETETERINAKADIGVLVVQRAGFSGVRAGHWWAVMHANAWILGARRHDFPVRMRLSDAAALLRAAGY